MKVYEVKGPCPELSIVLARIAAEAAEGEEVKIVSKWRYVLNDVEKSAKIIGLEVVSARALGDVVEVVVKKSARGRPLLQDRKVSDPATSTPSSGSTPSIFNTGSST